jgi:trimethylamine--corrinoid protein Co-methyltransferase
VPDAQAAHEKTITNLLPAIAGANLIYGMGMLESGQTWSHEQLVIDNDIVTMVKRVIQGIDVTDDTMAVDVVKQAHKIKDFLHQKHTIQFMRRQSRPKLIDRTTRGTWEAKGGKDLTQRAKEEARRIIKTHQPEPLSDDVKKTLREIVDSARKELVPD